MKDFLQKLALKFQKFMYGRYGTDQLFKALMVLYLVLIIITSIVGRFSRPAYYTLYAINLLIVLYTFFRVFSKNIPSRRMENQKYIIFSGKIKAYFKLQKDKFTQRKTHKFVKCSKCKTLLRLPRNKGKLKVDCPHCHNEFIINTGKKINTSKKASTN